MAPPRRLSLLILGMLAVALVVGATGAAPATTGASRTLAGQYTWGHSASRPLEARFTSVGGDRWDVEFHFVFNGERQRWSGEAAGSLDDGRLTGTAWTGGRTFRFAGEVTGGVFRGRHAEVYGDEEDDTGALELRPMAAQ